SLANAAVYGSVMSAAGEGIFLGSLVMSLWGGPRRRVGCVYFYRLILGLCLSLERLYPDALLLAGALLATSLAAPVANGCGGLLQYLVGRDLVVTPLGKLDEALRGHSSRRDHCRCDVAASYTPSLRTTTSDRIRNEPNASFHPCV